MNGMSIDTVRSRSSCPLVSSSSGGAWLANVRFDEDEPGGRYFVRSFGKGGTGGTCRSVAVSGADEEARSLSEADSPADMSLLLRRCLLRECLTEPADAEVTLVAVEWEPESRELVVVVV